MFIRIATENDASRLVTLLAQMGPKFVMSLEDMQNRIKAFNREDHQILIAEKDGLIHGLIAFGCFEQFRISGKCCHIDTLIIDEKSRGTGVGKQLYTAVEKYAEKHGATNIALITANWRKKTGTHAFYKFLGLLDHHALGFTYFEKERDRHGFFKSEPASENDKNFTSKKARQLQSRL